MNQPSTSHDWDHIKYDLGRLYLVNIIIRLSSAQQCRLIPSAKRAPSNCWLWYYWEGGTRSRMRLEYGRFWLDTPNLLWPSQVGEMPGWLGTLTIAHSKTEQRNKCPRVSYHRTYRLYRLKLIHMTAMTSSPVSNKGAFIEHTYIVRGWFCQKRIMTPWWTL